MEKHSNINLNFGVRELNAKMMLSRTINIFCFIALLTVVYTPLVVLRCASPDYEKAFYDAEVFYPLVYINICILQVYI